MARLLNSGVLPPGFYAVPFLDRDGPIEIDVATLKGADPTAMAAPPYAPAAPALTVAVEWPSTDDIRVEILADDGDPQLAAIVELISPRNKDRPKARAAFTAKCAGHLSRGCGLVVVDVVTCRRADLHAELLALLGVDEPSGMAGGLLAVAYRPLGSEEKGQLQIWPEALTIGQPLPTLPLWLGAELLVPLDLEVSHTAACLDLRVPLAG
jgi:hypothetical protein